MNDSCFLIITVSVAHGIRPERALLKHFATDTVMIKKQLSFKQISDLLDIPVAQLQVLNPSYKLDVIPFYQDQSHYLRLPQDKVAVFASNENIIYAYVQHELDRRERPFQAARAVAVRDTVNNYSAEKDTLSKTKYYRVRQGDNLTAIASKYDVSVSDLKIWNHLRSNLVSQGKNLKIITSESVVGSVNKGLKPDSFPINIAKDNQRLATTEVKNNKEEKDKKGIKTETLQSRTPISYVVQKGDNLGNIAKKFDVSVAEIQEWNHLSNANLQLGVSLQVAKQELDSVAEVAATPELKNIEYVVQKGDNLVNIAKKFGVAFTDLKHWNNISNNTIALGSSLIVSKNEVIITTNKAGVDSFKKKDNLALANNKERTEYFVKKGDSLYSISKKYPGVTISDLKKWNDIHEEELKPGMKLKING